MWTADNWIEYQLLESGRGERLELWGPYAFVRPDPQAVWDPKRKSPLWSSVHGVYHRSEKGGGSWEMKKPLPESWVVRHGAYAFLVKPMGFKHMGLFPEQAVNWRWSDQLIRSAGRPVRVLNLFAYTGGATVAAAAAGASVCHVDASKGMVAHAKENLRLSGLSDKPVRFLVDDCVKFVERELRRGNRYDAVILDPPSYGRGPSGEVWRIEEHLWGFLEKCVSLLSDNPLFVLVNSYTTGLSAETMKNLLSMTVKKRFAGTAEADEIGLPIRETGLVLPCGSSARWEMR